MIRKLGEGSFSSLMGGRLIREAALRARPRSVLAGDSGLGTGLVITLDGLSERTLARGAVAPSSSVLGAFRGPYAIRPARR